MFILDDIAMSPFKGFLFIAREVQKACEQQVEQDRSALMAELTSLHKKLEEGEIDEDEFDEKESVILARLESFDKPQ